MLKLFLLLLITALCAQSSPWDQPHAAIPAPIVHVVFSNHLDVGFTAWDNETINDYFHAHIPRAIWLADWLRLSGSRDSFSWTTQPWLLSLFMDCSPHMAAALGVACPSKQQQQAVAAAVRAGVVGWQAAPFNLQWELLGGSAAVAAALGIGRRLEQQLLGSSSSHHKTVTSLRDVPGLTRAVIPLLTSLGIRGITVGVNAGSAPPAVPLDTPFIWRDDVTNTSLLAIWHAGGYGGSCADVTTGQEVAVGCRQQCVSAPGFGHVLCFSWRADNQGPTQSALEVQQVFSVVRQQWPDAAAVVTSSLESFFDQLAAAVDGGRLTLPVVTGEIGDTWVYGAASDPLKLARYKAAARAREAWAQQQGPAAAAAATDGDGDADDAAAVARFDRLLLKVPEHTWGLDVKTTLSYFNSRYDNGHLHRCMAAAGGGAAAGDGDGCRGTARLTHSWQRQAAYVDWALQELPPDHPIVTSFNSEMEEMMLLARQAAAPEGPTLLPPSAVLGGSGASGSGSSSGSWLFRSHAWLIGVDQQSGAITKLCRAGDLQPAASGGGGGSSIFGLLPPGSREAAAAACTGNDWAAAAGDNSAQDQAPLFAAPLYVVHKQSDYDVIWNEYAWEGPPHTNPWFVMDFGKPGLNTSWDKHVEATPRFTRAHHSWSPGAGLALQLHYAFPDSLHREAGAPRAVVLRLASPPGSSALRLSLTWRDKAPTRLPEALWLRFRPSAADASSWRLHKLSSAAIDPAEVITNGSHSMHAVDATTGVTVTAAAAAAAAAAAGPAASGGRRERLIITPLDSPLVSPGSPTAFPNPDRPVDTRQGVSVNLHNNLWGTNYVQWLPYDQQQQAAQLHGCVGIGHSRRAAAADGQQQQQRQREAPALASVRRLLGASSEMGGGDDALCELMEQRTMVFRFVIKSE